jgi:hypothetical protein
MKNVVDEDEWQLRSEMHRLEIFVPIMTIFTFQNAGSLSSLFLCLESHYYIYGILQRHISSAFSHIFPVMVEQSFSSTYDIVRSHVSLFFPSVLTIFS